jgi:hypothetical protein
MRNTLRVGILCLMLVLSIIPYDLDWEKFVFTGYSATYSVTIIRHHFLVPLFFVILVIGLSFYKNIQNKWRKISLFIIGLFWFFSMRTIAIVESDNVIVQGWSIIGISKCNFAANDITNCSEMLDPFLRVKLEAELKNKLTPVGQE